MTDEKCRFFHTCPLVQPKGHTCNDQEEAAHGNGGNPYCGKYKELEDVEFRIKWK